MVKVSKQDIPDDDFATLITLALLKNVGVMIGVIFGKGKMLNYLGLHLGVKTSD